MTSLEILIFIVTLIAFRYWGFYEGKKEGREEGVIEERRKIFKELIK